LVNSRQEVFRASTGIALSHHPPDAFVHAGNFSVAVQPVSSAPVSLSDLCLSGKPDLENSSRFELVMQQTVPFQQRVLLTVRGFVEDRAE